MVVSESLRRDAVIVWLRGGTIMVGFTEFTGFGILEFLFQVCRVNFCEITCAMYLI